MMATGGIPELPAVPGKNETELDYTIEELKDIPPLNFKTYCQFVGHLAYEIEDRTGIYYLVPLIQSAHESRNGGSQLARKFANLFGIVATNSWKDAGRPIALLPTWEEIKGRRIDMSREFRAYNSWKESFEDWAKIITNLSIYKKAYELLRNKSTAREGIREMAKVYASDSQYATKLLSLYDQNFYHFLK